MTPIDWSRVGPNAHGWTQAELGRFDLWMDTLFLHFDLESTGVNTRLARIVQACAILAGPAHKAAEGAEPTRDTYSAHAEYVNPGVPIPAEASMVHGVTDDYVRRFGNPPAESIERLVQILADHLAARIPIAGMNLAYDFSLLHFEALRHGVVPLRNRVAGYAVMPVIDAYVLDKYADPFRKGSRKLADGPKGPGLASVYGVDFTGAAHDASADALAAGDVARAIGWRYKELGRMPLMLLHACQVDWRGEQAAGLQRYLRKEQPGVIVDGCWPECLDLSHSA